MSHTTHLDIATESGLLFCSLLKLGALRLCSHGEACEFCEQVYNLQQLQHVGSFLKDQHQRIPVKKARADNTAKWLKIYEGSIGFVEGYRVLCTCIR